MRIINTAELPRSPWKNGGGETIEIAVHPAGAGLDNFAWRLSMATVAADGPFSIFPGIDRTLAILDGDGMRLVIADRPAITLDTNSPPLAFAADQPATATLIGGAVTDLNVMSRRDRVAHTVERLPLDGSTSVHAAGSVTAIFCQTGGIIIALSGTTAALRPKVCALFTPSDGPCVLSCHAPASAVVIRISALPPAALLRESPR